MVKRWLKLWKRIGCRDEPLPYLVELQTLYSQPQRAHHNLAHIQHCLDQFETVRGMFQDPNAVEAANWYHDSIYDSRARNNEEKSGVLAESRIETICKDYGGSHITDNGLALGVIVDVMIRATKHTGVVTNDHDVELLLDIDLAILGQPPAVFDEYERNIRQEYKWVELPIYCRERVKILRQLAQPRVYRTSIFRQKYETEAQANIERSIKRLEDQLRQTTKPEQ